MDVPDRGLTRQRGRRMGILLSRLQAGRRALAPDGGEAGLVRCHRTGGAGQDVTRSLGSPDGVGQPARALFRRDLLSDPDERLWRDLLSSDPGWGAAG